MLKIKKSKNVQQTKPADLNGEESNEASWSESRQVEGGDNDGKWSGGMGRGWWCRVGDMQDVWLQSCCIASGGTSMGISSNMWKAQHHAKYSMSANQAARHLLMDGVFCFAPTKLRAQIL